MCLVSIPFLSRSDRGQSLQRCLDRVADRTGMDVALAAMAMSHFLDALADEITRGNCVVIPGFGLFSPQAVPARYLKTSKNSMPRCRPHFSAARGFRAQVAFGAPPSAVNAKQHRRHELNHGGWHRKAGARVFTAMQAFRDQIAAQLPGRDLQNGRES